jgi:hypothetical protein
MKWLLLGLGLAALPAQASDWLDVGARGPDRMYYDLSKLHIAPPAVTYWRRVEFRMPMPTAEGLAYSGLYRERIDCAQRKLATLGFLLYGEEGKVIANVYLPDARNVAIVPDSAAEQFAQSLCPIVQAHEALAKQEKDPKAAELRRLEEELKALEESIRSLRGADGAAGSARDAP